MLRVKGRLHYLIDEILSPWPLVKDIWKNKTHQVSLNCALVRFILDSMLRVFFPDARTKIPRIDSTPATAAKVPAIRLPHKPSARRRLVKLSVTKIAEIVSCRFT